MEVAGGPESLIVAELRQMRLTYAAESENLRAFHSSFQDSRAVDQETNRIMLEKPEHQLSQMRLTYAAESENLRAFHSSFQDSRAVDQEAKRILLEKLEHMVLQLTNIGAEMKKGYREELRQIRSYQDTQARELEKAIIQSVVDFLEESSVLVSGYCLQGEGQTGEVDGIVTGTFRGKQVVVLIESKHSLASKGTCVKAKDQLRAVADHWQELRRTDTDLEGGDATDFKNLQIQQHRHREIILAYGAYSFPEKSVQYFKHTTTHTTWLVKNNLSNRFVVQPIDSMNQVQ